MHFMEYPEALRLRYDKGYNVQQIAQTLDLKMENIIFAESTNSYKSLARSYISKKKEWEETIPPRNR